MFEIMLHLDQFDTNNISQSFPRGWTSQMIAVGKCPSCGKIHTHGEWMLSASVLDIDMWGNTIVSHWICPTCKVCVVNAYFVRLVILSLAEVGLLNMFGDRYMHRFKEQYGSDVLII